MSEFKELMPFFQTLLGGLMTLMGAFFVHGRSEKRDKDRLYRDTVQETFELLRRIETLYVAEAIVFYKGIRDSDIEKIRHSELGTKASEVSDKALALLELYFPYMEEMIDEFCDIEAELLNYHSHIIDTFSEIDLEDYNLESERLSEVMGEKISQMKYVLSDNMHKQTNFSTGN